MKIEFFDDNLSPIDHRFAAGKITAIARNLGLRRKVRFYLQGLHMEFNGDGPMPNTQKPDFGYDAEAWNTGIVMVAICRKQGYPFTYQTNPNLRGQYINGIAEIRNADELFVDLAAHELRHLWQWENPEKARAVRRAYKGDDETDADLYALMTLAKYRAGTL